VLPEGREVLEEDVTQEDLSSYIAAANRAISPFDLEIRSTVRQVSKQANGEVDGSGAKPRVYALVNTTSDSLTQLNTTYVPDEIAFVKRLLDAMFETYNTRRCEAMVVTGIQAMQLAKVSGDANRRESTNATGQPTQGGAAQSLTMSQAETMMSRLVDEGWLEKSAKGFYSLSPRGLMELRGWLVDTYNDEDDEGHRAHRIKFCAACREILTVVSDGVIFPTSLLDSYRCWWYQGQRCSNRDCLGRLHDMCVRNFFRVQQAEQCPVCKAPWPGDQFVGERAVTTTERYLQGKRRSQNHDRVSEADSSRVNGGAARDDEDESDENAEMT
jgi:hypothetical protein